MMRVAVSLSLLFATALVAKAAKPHILFIVADDLGYTDAGYKGSEIKTPVIDGLVTQGRSLTKYYVQSSCSPTRAAFHTGRYPARYNVDLANIGQFNQPRGVPLNETFLPEVLQRVGYRTHAIGKWHLGAHAWEYTPAYRGYESYAGYLQGAGSYFTHLFPWFVPPIINRPLIALEKFLPAKYQAFAPNSYDMWRQTKQNCALPECVEALVDQNNYYSTHFFTEEAVRVIKKHDPAEPFFMYLAFQAVHGPSQVPQSYVEPYSFIGDKKRRVYAGMLSALDEGIGKVTQAVKDHGMWDNTIVILTTDNGGPTETCETNGSQNKGLKGGKCSITEGGTRAESFVSGGALSTDVQGKPFERLMHGVDWLPTLAEAAGLNVSNSLTRLPLDGVSQWRNLQGQEDTEVHKEIFYGYSTGFPLPRSGSAIRDLRWKLIRGEDTAWAPLGKFPGGPWYCTPNCVNCSASKGYDFLDQECPKDISEDAESPRRLADWNFPFFGKKEKKIQLYDLLWDPAETTDLSADRPDIVEKLGARLDKWEADTYIAPGEDPAGTKGCPPQPAFPNHDGPNRVPILYPYCDLAKIATIV